jgi:hypothetical protein
MLLRRRHGFPALPWAEPGPPELDPAVAADPVAPEDEDQQARTN